MIYFLTLYNLPPVLPPGEAFQSSVLIYFSFYKMPKAAKTSTNAHRHSMHPYSVPSTTTIAPSTMANQETSLQAGTSDRHPSQSWPPENDALLMQARQQGMNWQPIASQYFSDKTANACRKRHERLMEKRNSADNWDGVKMDELAKAYADVREQMWKVLADRIGEKWQTVEAKVRSHPTHRPRSNT